MESIHDGDVANPARNEHGQAKNSSTSTRISTTGNLGDPAWDDQGWQQGVLPPSTPKPSLILLKADLAENGAVRQTTVRRRICCGRTRRFNNPAAASCSMLKFKAESR